MKKHDDDMYDLVVEVLRESKAHLLTDTDKCILEDYHYIFKPLKENAKEAIQNVAILIHNYRNDLLQKRIVKVSIPSKINNKTTNEDVESLKKHALFLIDHMGYSHEANEVRKLLGNLLVDTNKYVYKKPKLNATKNDLKEYMMNLKLDNYSIDIQDFLKEINHS